MGAFTRGNGGRMRRTGGGGLCMRMGMCILASERIIWRMGGACITILRALSTADSGSATSNTAKGRKSGPINLSTKEATATGKSTARESSSGKTGAATTGNSATTRSTASVGLSALFSRRLHMEQPEEIRGRVGGPQNGGLRQVPLAGWQGV